ncbi:MAG: hypothetical protein ACYTAS_14160, partial [Planctomycetota bacterium]
MKHGNVIFALLGAAIIIGGCAHNEKEKTLQSFVDSHVEEIKPLNKQAALAWWEAATTGADEAYDRSSELTLAIRKIYSN